MHEKVHDPEYKSYKPGVVVVRGMMLQSFGLGIYGVADIVEFEKQMNGSGISLPKKTGIYLPRPVEYNGENPKKGIMIGFNSVPGDLPGEMLQCHIAEADLYYGENTPPRNRCIGCSIKR